jgi:hypothetical protein
VIRAGGRLHLIEARVAGLHVAIGLDVRADLQSIASDEVAALRARQLQQDLHRLREFGTERQILNRVLEGCQIGFEAGVLPLLEF